MEENIIYIKKAYKHRNGNIVKLRGKNPLKLKDEQKKGGG